MSRWEKESHLKYCSPTPKLIIFGVGFLLASLLVKGAEKIVNQFYELINEDSVADFKNLISLFIAIAVITFITAIIEFCFRSCLYQSL